MRGGGSYYDDEAPVYDATRGGAARAHAAAAAVAELVPAPDTAPGTALDVAGGTGSVSAELSLLGWSVLVLDRSAGMLGLAAGRLPGRAAVARAERLPVRDGAVDLVVTVWLLHLLPIEAADRVVAEAARVLRPGGHFVTTVDKDLAHGRVRRTNGDHRDRVEQVARRLGLATAGSSYFDAETKWRTGSRGQRFPVAAFRKGAAESIAAASVTESTRWTTGSIARPRDNASSSGQAG
jgi:ubiquinone/menaquinone biosynthesis C-methylase UbiE